MITALEEPLPHPLRGRSPCHREAVERPGEKKTMSDHIRTPEQQAGPFGSPSFPSAVGRPAGPGSPSVALLTLHTVRDYGSVLQTLATQVLLESAGARCTVLDFRRENAGDDALHRLAGSRHGRGPLMRRAYGLVHEREARRRALVFQDFLARRINLTRRHYDSYESLRGTADQYDSFCVGSDQVWNIARNLDNRPFYLSFLPPGVHRFSFASSPGTPTLPALEEERAVRALSAFDALSVREPSARDYLAGLGLDVQQHVDPTLAIPPAYWRGLASDAVLDHEYLLVHQLNRNPLLTQAVSRLAARTGLPVVRIGHWPTARMPLARRIVLPTVEDFLALIRDASLVVTDSFHGVALSHVFATQFIAAPPPQYGGCLASVLGLLGTRSRLIRSAKQTDVLPLRFGPLLFDRRRLGDERLRAGQYLRSCLAPLRAPRPEAS